MKQCFVLGENHLHFESLPSTQTWLEERWQKHLEWPSGTLVTADDQTAGKGQHHAKWLTEPGANFTGTYLLRNVPVVAEQMFVLNKAVVLAVREVVAFFLPPKKKVQVKWPNDVVVEGNKISGLLIQAYWKGPQAEALLIGLGLNVNQKQFAPEIARKSTSLALEAMEVDNPITIPEVIARLNQQLAFHLETVFKSPEKLAQDYLFHLYLYQEWAQFRFKDNDFTGRIVGVDTAGQLVLETAKGIVKAQPKEVLYL